MNSVTLNNVTWWETSPPRLVEARQAMGDSSRLSDSKQMQRTRMLIVEDDEGDAVLVERALKSCSNAFELQIVASLGEAQCLLENTSFDLILLDLSLPDSFGLESVNRLRELSRQTPIVVLTGLDDNRMALEALEMGAQDYLVKGEWSQESLTRTLRYAIQRHHVLSENERLLVEIQRQSRFDSLTGVLNRQSFTAELEREWSRTTRNCSPLSCVMIDVDLFKKVNDSHGHAVGDNVLQVVGAQIQQPCRTGDLVGRYGGEEFCVLLPDTDEQGAVVWSERLRAAIEVCEFVADSKSFTVTVSLGVAQRHEDTKSALDLIELADHALLRAKRFGRNRVVCQSQLNGSHSLHCVGASKELENVRAIEIMTPLHQPVSASAKLSDVSRYMIDSGLEIAPIANEHGELVGVVTDDDLIREMSSARGWLSPVVDFMNRRPACLPLETPAKDVLEFMQRGSFRQVLLIKDQRAVGIVSRSNVVNFFHFSETQS